MNGYKLLIADRSPLYREGVKLACREVRHTLAFYEAGSATGLQQQLDQQPDIDLIVLDVALFESQLRQWLCQLDIPILLTCGSRLVVGERQLRRLGVRGVLSKQAPLDDVPAAIATLLGGAGWFRPDGVAGGEPIHSKGQFSAIGQSVSRLTPREHTVLDLLAGGLMNKEIAFQLDLNESTVKRHVSNIYRKLRIHNRTHLVLAMNGGMSPAGSLSAQAFGYQGATALQ
ncbi:response regulator transcription factor [Marinobacterium arenosum]|uniref:response regulator transcription factor n=1 Tax=Marinobacterium arenosum TaxID=2862496 RepID=UPI001C95129C|nr:response regulator transcription factor [Marinobacterium arenosum]MBY4675119.1 response regulator transcription factor [Marinobacterium arenosum]